MADYLFMRPCARHGSKGRQRAACAQVDVSKASSFRRRIHEASVLELPGGGGPGGGPALLALHLRGTAFLWHQARAGARRQAAASSRACHDQHARCPH